MRKFFKMRPAYPSENYGIPLGDEEELTLKPFRFEEKDNFNGTGRISLHMYCFNKNSDSILARIDNFRVYCCIELPTQRLIQQLPPDGDIRNAVYRTGSNIFWDKELATNVYKAICYKQSNSKKGKDPKEIPFDYVFNFFKDIYYYTNKKKPYLYLFFDTLQGRNDLNLALKYPIFIPGEGYMQLTMHENKITTFRRLMSKRNIKFAQWFNVKGVKVPVESRHRISKHYCTEYIINYDTMVGIPEIETSKWFVYPKVFAWDIETYSKNHKQMPSSSRRSDCVYAISVVFQFLERPETRRKYCLVFGNCNPITGSEIIRFATEKEMLFGFCAMFDYLDPDILTGYNTDMYDWPYILARFERNGIKIEDIPNTGRLINSVSRVFSSTWSSSGAGNNKIIHLIQDGREASFDMLKNIKRIYKFRMYTLEYVSQSILKEGKHDIKAKEMFKIYEDSIGENKGVLVKDHDGEMRTLKMDDVIKYCIQDSILPIKLMDKTKIWYHLSSLSNVAGVSMNDLVTRGEQIRCYSNIAHECYLQNTVLSNPKFYDYYYKGGFVAKPKPGVYKYVFTLDFSSLYPSIMQAYNLSPDTLIQICDWPNVPEHLCEIIEFDQEEPRNKLSGSYRQDLEDKYKLYIQIQHEAEQARLAGKEYKPPCTVKLSQDDVNNLIMLGNSAIKTFTFNPENSTEDIVIDPDDLSLTQTVMRHYEFRFIKKEYTTEEIDKDGNKIKVTHKLHEGIMPMLERNWVSSRKAVKKLMAACEDILEQRYDPEVESERIVHNAHQNCIKIVANSGYGFCGVQKGMLPCVFVAICVTALGRRLIGIANERLVEEFKKYGAKIVYNDTDSSMVSLELDGTEDLEEICHLMEDVINGRKEKILYNNDSTVINVEIEEVNATNEKLKLKNDYYSNGMIKKKMRKVKETTEDDEGNIKTREVIKTTYYADDATIKEILPPLAPVFKDPLKMECENCCQFCPLKSKYYLKLMRNTNRDDIIEKGEFKKNHNGEYEIMQKGVLTSKKGNAKFANIVYKNLSDKTLFMDNIQNKLRSLSTYVCNILNDKFEARDLCRVTSVSSGYNNETYFMAVFVNYLISKGITVNAGERLEYIIVRTKEEMAGSKDVKIGNKCREIGMWEEDENREPIDYVYYIESGLQEQYDYLFYVGEMNILDDPRLCGAGYKPQFSNCKFVHFKTPIKMITALIKDYMRLNDYDFAGHSYIFCRNFGFNHDINLPRNRYLALFVNHFIEKLCYVINTLYPINAI